MKKDSPLFDVIVIGGSYAGLAAGMALGRSLRKALIIDAGEPCNKQTPHSHNFLTQDGNPPGEIARLGRQQVEQYSTVSFFNGLATEGRMTGSGFEIQVASGEKFGAKKLIFATGIRDLLPPIEGFAACWGISVVHCPYCHGYEIRNKTTGILSNNDHSFEFAGFISNWTKDLTLFSNGPSVLTDSQKEKLRSRHIPIVEKEVANIEHTDGHIRSIIFKDGTRTPLDALYGPVPFQQHCAIPEALGCELTEDGYIKIDALQKTSVKGIYACGDNAGRLRTVANAVSTGAIAAMMLNKELISEELN